MISALDLSKRMNFTVEDGIYGPKFVLRGWWREQAREFIRQEGILELELNYANNWPIEELDFLNSLQFLESLQIIAHGKLDLSPVAGLTRLKNLRLDALSTTEIDFSALSDLETCYVEWHHKCRGVLTRSSLRDLYLQSFKQADGRGLVELSNLQSLKIGNGSVHALTGIERLQKIRMLGLYHLRKLTSLCPLEDLQSLEELDIWGCRSIQTLCDQIARVSRLRALTIINCGKVDSLAPLLGLRNLEELHFGEGTIIEDGDISVLLGLPNLANVTFSRHRHYSHTPEQFLLQLAARDN